MGVEKKHHGKKSTYEQQVEQHMADYLLRNVAQSGKTPRQQRCRGGFYLWKIIHCLKFSK